MSTTSTVRVVVVEDHPVTRMGVVALLGQDERIEVVGEAGAGEDALGVVAREHPDVVVTDLRLGDGSTVWA
ncbi:response regulator [Janibacter indicus]|uniref:Response regulator receiver domain-containing protein n=1 Tax=Janibacter indicus TaxID=857417 RepID=A0A1W2B983_9MICO|nr:response regulator [Janibacter indicus]SMC69583.1 Response regulator receiver domain-containing protein [Janibacter indicus]